MLDPVDCGEHNGKYESVWDEAGNGFWNVEFCGADGAVSWRCSSGGYGGEVFGSAALGGFLDAGVCVSCGRGEDDEVWGEDWGQVLRLVGVPVFLSNLRWSRMKMGVFGALEGSQDLEKK